MNTHGKDTRKDMRRLLAKLALALGPVLALVMAVNYIGDPGELFYRRHWRGRIVELVAQGQNVRLAAVPAEWGGLQIGLIKNLTAGNRTPDVAVWGTSRSSEFCRKDFAVPFFNHVVPGGSILDYVALYALYRQQGHMPRMVIISIDPWTFSARKPVQIGNQQYFAPDPAAPLAVNAELKPYCAAGLRQLGLAPEIPDTQKNSPDWRRMANLFSLTYFQSAVKSLKQIMPQATPLDSLAGAFILRQDGSYTLCPEPSLIRPPEVAETARGFAKAVSGCLMDRSVTPAARVEILDRLIAALASQGTRVVLYLAPIHPDAYDRLVNTPPSPMEIELAQLCKKHGVTLIGAFNPHPYGLEADKPFFFDQYHPTRSALDLILEKHAAALAPALAPVRKPTGP